MRLLILLLACSLSTMNTSTVVAGGPLSDIVLTPVLTGLSGAVAVDDADDGTSRMFIVFRAGQIRIWDRTQLLPTDFLDISSRVVSASGEEGLLGIAFHPDYENNGFFYVNYIFNQSGSDVTRISRFSVDLINPNIANPNSETVLMEIEQDSGNHNGGSIHFGPDGYLYIGMGDGGGANDPNNRGQTIQATEPPDCADASCGLLGAMLRIDVDQSSPGIGDICGNVQFYGIPNDNPFAGEDDNCDEIWSYGLRNPWQFSFDMETGDMYIGDVGQDAWEEINFQPAASTGGENYGWRPCEGDHPRGNTSPGSTCGIASVAPILEESHVTTSYCSIAGGFRYRGPVLSLQGLYIYGDFCSSTINFVEFQGVPGVGSQIVNSANLGNVVAFGEDQFGEVYVIRSGSLYRFDGVREETLYEDEFETPVP